MDTLSVKLRGVSDLQILTINGQKYLAVAAEADSAISIYSLANPAAPVWQSEVVFSALSGTNTLSDLVGFVVGGQTKMLALGRYDDNFGLYNLETNGALTLQSALSDGLSTFNRGNDGAVVGIGANTYAFSAAFGISGFQSYSVDVTGMLTPLTKFNDTGTNSLGDVTAFGTITRGTNTYVFVASGLDAGLHSYKLNPNGSLSARDQVLPGEFHGFNGITDMASTTIGSRGFLVVASAGTNSLAVYRVSEGGKLKEVEFLLDTRDTRFGNVQAVEIIKSGDKTYVLAGGGDDGITVLELTERGHLRVVAVLADEFTTTLANISSIEVLQVGNLWHIYVGSITDHGFTVLEFNPGTPGLTIRGGRGNDVLTGGPGDDVIWGMGHRDQLFGGAGNDRLIDGRGRDQMTGGPGADIFEFTPDRQRDKIMDFEMGIDRIDLSNYNGIYHISALTFQAKAFGARITVLGDVMDVINPGGGPFNIADFTQDMFIFG